MMDRQKVHWIRKKLLQEAAVSKCIRKLDARVDGAAVHTIGGWLFPGITPEATLSKDQLFHSGNKL